MESNKKTQEQEKNLDIPRKDVNFVVKSLKFRIRELEKYKNLCEQRLVEIVPDHPIPVRPDHLGVQLPMAFDLTLAKQKIAKLRHEITRSSFSSNPNENIEKIEKYENWMQEKSHLEDCLRAEVLNCEEQRTYIEILKQKLEEIQENTSQAEFKSQDLKNFDFKREIANLRSENKDLESQNEKLRQSVQIESQKFEEISIKQEELIESLDKMQERLQRLEDENIKLEEEKNSLLEYIDEHSHKEEEMEQDMNELGKLFEEMKANYSEAMKKFHEETVKNTKTGKEIEELKEKLEASAKTAREVQFQNEAISGKLQGLKEGNKAIKDEKLNLEMKIENLLINNATLSEILKETQDELENLKAVVEIKNKTLKEKDENITTLKSELDSKVKSLNSLGSVINSLEYEKIMKIEEKAEVAKDFELEKQKFSSLKSQVVSLNDSLKTLQSQLNDKNKQIQTLQNEINSSKDEKVDLSRLRTSNAETLKTQEEIQSKYKNLVEQNNEILLTQEKNFDEVQKLKETNEILRAELEDYERIIYENQELQSLLAEEKKTFLKRSKLRQGQNEIEINELKSNQEKLDSLVSELQTTLDQERYLNQYLQETLKDLKLKYDRQEFIFLTLQNRVYSAAASILENLPVNKPDYLQKLSILSNDFSEFLRKFDLNSSPEAQEICKFAEMAAENLKFLININLSLQDEVSNKNYEISLHLNKAEDLSSELDTKQQVILSLNNKLESNYKENLTLKAEFQMLSQENYELKTNLSKYSSSMQDLKASSDYLESALRSLELENKSLKDEKGYLESILKTCKSGISKENFLTSNELESLERDRLDIQYQMLKYQSDPRSKDGMMLRELGNRLEVCERQISSFYGSSSGRVRTETPMRKFPFKPELRPLSLNRLRHDSATPVRDKSIYNNVI